MDDREDIWAGAEVISSYSRAQALEDGVLVDVSGLAREAGFRFPVAVTAAVWAILDPSEALKAEGQSWEGRAWDLLVILRAAIGGANRGESEVAFSPLFVLNRGEEPRHVALRSVCGPGDGGEGVITVMLPTED